MRGRWGWRSSAASLACFGWACFVRERFAWLFENASRLNVEINPQIADAVVPLRNWLLGLRAGCSGVAGLVSLRCVVAGHRAFPNFVRETLDRFSRRRSREVGHRARMSPLALRAPRWCTCSLRDSFRLIVMLETLSWCTSERARSGVYTALQQNSTRFIAKGQVMELLTRLLELRRREHLSTVDLLEALLQWDRTRTHLDLGYDSMWSLLVGALRYSNAAASRRHRALKCVRKFPVALEWLRAERVTLCSLEAIAPLLDEFDDEQALLDRIEGKSHAEVQRIVAQTRPVSERREVVRTEFVEKKVAAPAALFETADGEEAMEQATPPPAEERVRVTLSLTPEEFAWIERARLLASRRPGRAPSVHDMVVETARFYVEKRAPKKRAAKSPKEPRAKAAAELANYDESSTAIQPPTPPSRHIPDAIRDAVFLRDGERCTFVGITGQRCEAKHHLNVDHVMPFSLGGANTLDNLRVVCGAHNRRRSDLTFGEWGIRGVPVRKPRPSLRE